MMGVVGLGYFGIGASDTSAWRQYAERVLGCPVLDGEDGALLIRVDTRIWRIEVTPTGEDDIVYAGWELDGPASMVTLVAQLRSGGVAVEDDADLAKRRGVEALARFVDPTGLQSELFWGATERSDLPFLSPTGTRGFVTGDQGLGHIVLSTRDPEGMEAFYRDLLGFRTSDYIYDPRMGADRVIKVTFMHGNPRHHSLAFAAVPAPKRLLHFMLQTEELDDVGRALDRVAAEEVPLALSLGRHVNDHMVSFYAWTPSGFEVEYGWGARVVDDESWTVTRHERISTWGHRMINPPGSVPDWRPRA